MKNNSSLVGIISNKVFAKALAESNEEVIFDFAKASRFASNETDPGDCLEWATQVTAELAKGNSKYYDLESLIQAATIEKNYSGRDKNGTYVDCEIPLSKLKFRMYLDDNQLDNVGNIIEGECGHIAKSVLNRMRNTQKDEYKWLVDRYIEEIGCEVR